jgi:hypothetical protein
VTVQCTGWERTSPLPTKNLRIKLVNCLDCKDYTQGVSRLVYITAGGYFLGLCDQKTSYKHVSDFEWLRSYDRMKLRIEGSDY